ncbi:MAG TPA: TetR family transcriptional regulator [Euzebya sp.]|nr:TetR family transcriptional regulator [Euzebya sp.]
MSPRSGRRPGASGARKAILDSARASFAANGYDGATIRGIARDADVDPALVHHYFGTKQHLFAASLDVPVDPGEIISATVVGDPATLGSRLAHTFLSVYDVEVTRGPIIALVRSATTNEQAATMVREFLSREIFQRITAGLEVADPQLRAGLAASQLIGVVLMRYVVRVEPLASLPRDQLADHIAPTLQHYLTGELAT